MDFLKYIELSAENLQFFLWYRNYTRRFDQLPATEKILSPEWTSERPAGDAKPKPAENKADYEVAAILQGTDFAAEPQPENANNPFFTPPHTPTTGSIVSYEESTTTTKTTYKQRASTAFEGAGLKWKPRESCHIECLHDQD
jgi:hypothetical protein